VSDFHYPSIRPELVTLTTALHQIAHDAHHRSTFIANRQAFADAFLLDENHAALLVKLDVPALVALGVHPLVPFLANMQVQRQQAGEAHP
jgi:2,3-dihydroxyphenylpropionate 1,2-dioxygenase